jgi:holo-[acyl-carrier protein] synthase
LIYALGTDIAEVARFEKKAINNPALLNHIFSKIEQDYCFKQKFPYISFTARFAAKEAFLKAFGVKFIGNHALPEIEINNDEHGKPSIVLHGKSLSTFQEMQLSNIHISISHTKDYAMATVILEKIQ